jgi:hypothetical protein
LHERGDQAGAAEALCAQRDIYDRLDARDTPAGLATRRLLAEVLIALDRLDEAEPLAREALRGTRAVFGDLHRDTAAAMETLGMLLIARQDAGQAERLLRRCVAIHEQLDGPDGCSRCTAHALGTLGQCLTILRRFDEAEPLLLRSHAASSSATGEFSPTTREAARRIVALHEAAGEPDRAAKWKERLGAGSARAPR